MARVKVREFDKVGLCRPDPAESSDAGVVSLGVFDGDDDPIHARLHRLQAGEQVTWRHSGPGHLAYVWDGQVTVGGHVLSAADTFLIEHGAGVTATAAEPATLLLFTLRADHARSQKAGGHVHLLHAGDAPSILLGEEGQISVTLYADSGCPDCELWLHGNDFHQPGHVTDPHYHTEDEVIIVTAGEILLGKRAFGRGTAIAVQKDTIYGFSAGPDGLSFINFRPSRPTYGQPGAGDPMDERAFYAILPSPPRTYVA